VGSGRAGRGTPAPHPALPASTAVVTARSRDAAEVVGLGRGVDRARVAARPALRCDLAAPAVRAGPHVLALAAALALALEPRPADLREVERDALALGDLEVALL